MILSTWAAPAVHAAVWSTSATSTSTSGSPTVPSTSIVYTSNATGTTSTAPTANYEIFVANDDGTGAHRLTFDTSYNSVWPRISPDRTRILFYRTLASSSITDYTQMSLWMMNADGSGIKELLAEHVYGWAAQGHAEWSPDGKHLVMFAEVPTPQLFVTAADGTSPRLLTARPEPSFDPSWSPDGRTIVFITCAKMPCPMTASDVFTIPSAGGSITQLTSDNLRDNDPYFSPDGSHVVFESQLATPTSTWPAGVWELQTVGSNGTGLHVVLSDGNVNTTARWSADGTTLYFSRFVYGARKFQVWTMHTDGFDLLQVTHSLSANSEMVGP